MGEKNSNKFDIIDEKDNNRRRPGVDGERTSQGLARGSRPGRATLHLKLMQQNIFSF